MIGRPSSSAYLFQEAKRRGYSPFWIVPDQKFGCTVEGMLVEVYQTRGVGNIPQYSKVTKNKYQTRQFLEKFGFPNIPYCYTKSDSQLQEFFRNYHPIIAKPIEGQRAEKVILVQNEYELASIPKEKTIFEQYMQGNEYRVFFLEGTVVGMQRKTLWPSLEQPWRKQITNLEKEEWDPTLLDLSKQIYSLIPQPWLAVDWIQDDNKRNWVLELNSYPGISSSEQPDSGVPNHLSSYVLDRIIKFQEKGKQRKLEGNSQEAS